MSVMQGTEKRTIKITLQLVILFAITLCAWFVGEQQESNRRKLNNIELSATAVARIEKGALHILELAAECRLKQQLPLDPDDISKKKWSYFEAYNRSLHASLPRILRSNNENEISVVKTSLGNIYGANKQCEDSIQLNLIKSRQPLIEIGFMSQTILMFPDFFHKLEPQVKKGLSNALIFSRSYPKADNNIALFFALNEAALYTMGQESDINTITDVVSRFNEKYIGNGIYSESSEPLPHHLYNSYVIHPALIELTNFCRSENLNCSLRYETQLKRAKYYVKHLCNLIEPSGKFKTIGRSSIYRTGGLYLIAYMIETDLISETNTCVELANSALVADVNQLKFDNKGFLTGDPNIYEEEYISTGSYYIALFGYLHL